MDASIDIVIKVIPATETYFGVYATQTSTSFLLLQNSYLLQTDGSKIVLAEQGR